MAQILFKNANLLDPRADALAGRRLGPRRRRVDPRSLAPKPIKAANADVIDCKGRTLMPGLIDCHVHVMLSEVNIRYLEAIPLTMMTVRAAALMRAMIDRGFTTVRDTGGADWGMRDGVAQGLLPGPRMFIAGRAIGPTGGHSDARRRTDVRVGRLQVLQRDELLPGGRRWRRRRSRGGARAASAGRRPDQDHGVGRRREPLRSARQPAVLARRNRRRRRGSRGLRPLHAGPCLHAGRDHARREPGRAHDRARQPDRREVGRADEGERRLPRGEPRRLLRDEGAREGIRHDRRDAGEERSRHRRRAEVAGDLQARRHQGRLRQRSPRRSCRSTRAASSCCAARCCRRSRSSGRRRSSAPRSCACRASSAW